MALAALAFARPLFSLPSRLELRTCRYLKWIYRAQHLAHQDCGRRIFDEEVRRAGRNERGARCGGASQRCRRGGGHAIASERREQSVKSIRLSIGVRLGPPIGLQKGPL